VCPLIAAAPDGYLHGVGRLTDGRQPRAGRMAQSLNWPNAN
jgi:hypothetical protein